MPSVIDSIRHENRLVARMVGREVLDALQDLFDLLPDAFQRSRIGPAATLCVLARMRFDNQLRGRPRERHDHDGLSVSAIARSLDMPFETTRRQIRLLERCGWVETGMGTPHVRLPDTLPAPLIGWLGTLTDRCDRIATQLDQAGLYLEAQQCRSRCASARICAVLDMLLSTFEISSPMFARKRDQLVVQLVISLSVRTIADDLPLSRTYAYADTVPPVALRRAVTIEQIAERTGLSHSTIYRAIDDAELLGTLERCATGGVRAREAFLAGDAFVESQRLLAGKTAALLDGLADHHCTDCERSDDAMFVPSDFVGFQPRRASL